MSSHLNLSVPFSHPAARDMRACAVSCIACTHASRWMLPFLSFNQRLLEGRLLGLLFYRLAVLLPSSDGTLEYDIWFQKPLGSQGAYYYRPECIFYIY